MGLLFISEYPQNSIDTPTLVMEPSTVSQVVTFTTSTQSAAFRTDTRMVRLHNDATSPVAFKFGTNPTAVSGTDARMAANQTEYFKVNPGFKVAAVTTT